MEFMQVFLPAVDDPLLMRGRLIAKPAVVAGDADVLNQTERGKQLRLGENRFGENLFVKQIQAPRPKPHQVDRKNREYDRRDKGKPQKHFHDALKHKDSP